MESLVTFQAALVNQPQLFRHGLLLRPVGLERGRSHHLGIPILSPNTIGRAQARRPREHCPIELDSDSIAEQTQNSLGIEQNISGVNDRRCSLILARDPIEDLDLLHKAEVFDYWSLVFLHI